jgi:hypothetical protein
VRQWNNYCGDHCVKRQEKRKHRTRVASALRTLQEQPSLMSAHDFATNPQSQSSSANVLSASRVAALTSFVTASERLLLFEGEGCKGRNDPAACNLRKADGSLAAPALHLCCNGLLRFFGLLRCGLLDGLGSCFDGDWLLRLEWLGLLEWLGCKDVFGFGEEVECAFGWNASMSRKSKPDGEPG